MKLRVIAASLMVSALWGMPLAAHAAGLGKITVKSALGQLLDAEVEVFAADKAELDSLSAALANLQAYKEARIEYTPALGSVRMNIVKEAAGKALIKITSTRPLTEPFLDMLIELNWANGRLVREYTVLLDPPAKLAPATAPANIVAPVASAPAVVAPAAPSGPVVQGDESKAPFKQILRGSLRKALPEDTPPPVQQAAPASPAPASTALKAQAAGAGQGEVTIKRGDTLTAIAARVKPESVSLEQALVGLQQENPDAFAKQNMNRLLAGQTLKLPDADRYAAIKQVDAVREVRLQAADWQAYRSQLAATVSQAPAVDKPAQDSIASGKIAPKVEDQAKPADQTPGDVLKLSKSAPAAGAGKAEQTAPAEAPQDDAAARDKSVEESKERVASLEKQVQQMQELVESKTPPVAAPPVETPKTPGPGVVVDTSEPATASEGGFDLLAKNPLYWWAGGIALALGGVLWWMMTAGGRRRKAPPAFEDTLVNGTATVPVTTLVNGTSGGPVNTGDTSFLTDFSQAGIGAIDTHDVDPIAEAEVYMAYGRDSQAEEILKEALLKTPNRQEIRAKLLEIYATRKNPLAFEAVASELRTALADETSPLWQRAAKLGYGIDPGNPLYASAAPVAVSATPPTVAEGLAAGAVAASVGVVAANLSEPEPEIDAFAEASAELPTPGMNTPDIASASPEHWDFTLDESPVAPAEAAELVLSMDHEAEPEHAEEGAEEIALIAPPEPDDFLALARQMTAIDTVGETSPPTADFSAPGLMAPVSESPDTAFSPDTESPADILDFDGLSTPLGTQADDSEAVDFELADLDLPEATDTGIEIASLTPSSPDFDMSTLDLALDLPDEAEATDEVGTKLDLARAYMEMGDREGAQEILQEVLSEGNETQKSNAQSLLAALV
jgi:pilus assembly protein FimV